MAEEIVLVNEADRSRVLGMIQSLDLSRRFSVTVKRKTKRRTLSQNALYWKWVGIISEETGNTPDDVHEGLKEQFITPKEVTIFDSPVLVRSTKDKDTKAMSEYMDNVYQFALSWGIMLPTPDMLGVEIR